MQIGRCMRRRQRFAREQVLHALVKDPAFCRHNIQYIILGGKFLYFINSLFFNFNLIQFRSFLHLRRPRFVSKLGGCCESMRTTVGS